MITSLTGIDFDLFESLEFLVLPKGLCFAKGVLVIFESNPEKIVVGTLRKTVAGAPDDTFANALPLQTHAAVTNNIEN